MRQDKRIAKQRVRRRLRVRNRIRAARPARLRLSVFRSNRHIYAQIIDDEAGHTLVAASTAEAAICPKGQLGGDKQAAARVGAVLAERAKHNGVTQVAFDRGRYRYHGRIAALADAVREAGLQF